MNERKELGKIKHITFGFGGYQEAQMALDVTLGGEGWGVSTSEGFWAKHDERCKWTEEDQLRRFGELVIYIRDLLRAAKCQSVHELRGVPVECTFDGNKLVSWRILTEVI